VYDDEMLTTENERCPPLYNSFTERIQ